MLAGHKIFFRGPHSIQKNYVLAGRRFFFRGPQLARGPQFADPCSIGLLISFTSSVAVDIQTRQVKKSTKMKGLIKKHRALLLFVLLLGDGQKRAFSTLKCKQSDWSEGGYDASYKNFCSEEGQKHLQKKFDILDKIGLG